MQERAPCVYILANGKRWRREWKLNLIEKHNPGWVDLAVSLGFDPL